MQSSSSSEMTSESLDELSSDECGTIEARAKGDGAEGVA